MRPLPPVFYQIINKDKGKPKKLTLKESATAPKGYVMVGSRNVKLHMGDKGSRRYNTYELIEPQQTAPVPVQQAEPAPAPQYVPPMQPVPLPVNQPQQPAFDPMAMYMPLLMQALAPKPVQPIPEPVTYASAGQAAQSVPGVRIRRSPASINKQNTLGTRGAFNRDDLRITNLNI